ncbi:hypothetical protein [Flavobacterium gawalongense]|uniref:Lipoprotein n=1 Tax=Flavobacterium gawalongense TaxID=2594432 RepID=A0A553BRZ6_9FLAO|nr:hypothetical protein [Flavobacterium gawalongense]TRX03142.1 hypothetical protein FNW33_04735 [Flavobacterium gawalongense]TRX09804.1 hypothetical protein FNW12_01425 [Flavobacterium gawalongense]TRX11030.1 hypothetical protein FNW11_06545 [Flavobacterium gawalongense]TRX12007.1 hypothetical protein FNW10_05830 [Flavobacterium gawalongense]TRX29853.1 hypothetical protein FNW38_05925 [Flavobacterium gawalongense]
MKLLFKLLALNCAIFFISCSGESSSESEVKQVKDDFSYLVVNSTGKINKIGNKTGAISTYSAFNGFNTSAFLDLNTVTSNSNKIFLIEYLSTDKLFVFDKNTNLTTSNNLVYPSALTGLDPALISLQWNDSNNLLFGILKSNKDDSKSICYFVTINPTTFEVIYTGISFNQKSSFSTFINGNKFYSSCYNDNTIEINLENNTSKPLFFNSSNTPISFTRSAISTNNILYGMKGLVGNINGVSLFKFDLLNNTYTDILPNEVYGLNSVFGKGFIDNSKNQYVIISNLNNKSGILKYNISSNSTEFVDINEDSNMVIIEKISN